VNAAPNIPFGRNAGRHAEDQIPVQNGGYLRGDVDQRLLQNVIRLLDQRRADCADYELEANSLRSRG
jgi:hypothetical protein